ncbi:hypothetical protein ES705_07768 [subsurface metagenome]
MKKLYFLAILFLILAMFLTGCGVTPETEESKINSVIQEYFLALSNQDWDRARNYCVIGSDFYFATVQLQNDIEGLLNTAKVSLYFIIEILDTVIICDYAKVTLDGTMIIIVDGIPDEYPIYGQTCSLQKIGNNWKMYSDLNGE